MKTTDIQTKKQKKPTHTHTQSSPDIKGVQARQRPQHPRKTSRSLRSDEVDTAKHHSHTFKHLHTLKTHQHPYLD